MLLFQHLFSGSNALPTFGSILALWASLSTATLGINCLNSQVAGNNRPLYPKVDHDCFKAARNYEPLALQVEPRILRSDSAACVAACAAGPGSSAALAGAAVLCLGTGTGLGSSGELLVLAYLESQGPLDPPRDLGSG